MLMFLYFEQQKIHKHRRKHTNIEIDKQTELKKKKVVLNT